MSTAPHDLGLHYNGSRVTIFIPKAAGRTPAYGVFYRHYYGESTAIVVAYDRNDPNSSVGSNASLWIVPTPGFPEIEPVLPVRSEFWKQGYELAKAGALPQDCPYAEGQYAFEQWMMGWSSYDVREEW